MKPPLRSACPTCSTQRNESPENQGGNTCLNGPKSLCIMLFSPALTFDLSIVLCYDLLILFEFGRRRHVFLLSSKFELLIDRSTGKIQPPKAIPPKPLLPRAEGAPRWSPALQGARAAGWAGGYGGHMQPVGAGAGRGSWFLC